MIVTMRSAWMDANNMIAEIMAVRGVHMQRINI